MLLMTPREIVYPDYPDSYRDVLGHFVTQTYEVGNSVILDLTSYVDLFYQDIAKYYFVPKQLLLRGNITNDYIS